MATQQIRNILSSQVESKLEEAKQKVRDEGKKKIDEVKQKIPTPEDVIAKLKAEINKEACSVKGKEKFMKKYNQLNDRLTKLLNVIKSAIEKIEGIENKIKPIIEAEGPLGKINEFADFFKENIMPILQVVIMAAPMLLAAQTTPVVSGVTIDQTQKKRDLAVSKVKELSALLLSIPLMIIFYQNQAKKIFVPLDLIKSKLEMVKEQITKIQLFMYSLLLQFEDQCNELEQSQNSSLNNNNPISPDPNSTSSLEKYMAFLKDQYEDVYNKLQEAGNEKAVERIFKVKSNLEEDYNISFKVIKFGKKIN
tara:strand:+ start:2262 stop:3185 length:924 start_codon:yes stop_codon:yes gene_type:complete